jgi:hypothetical protein
VIHREFFRAALGSNKIGDLALNQSTVNTAIASVASILQTAEAFEDLGVAAYNGAGKYLTSADYLTIADPPSGRLDFGSGDFTVCLWVKTNQTRTFGTWPTIIDKVDLAPSNTRRGYEFILGGPGGAGALFQVWTGVPDPVFVEAPGISDGRWHHLVGRRTASEVAVYGDGVRKNALPAPTGSTSNSVPLYFGSMGAEPSNDFDGQIDDVRLYSRALSDAEIQALASGVSP